MERPGLALSDEDEHGDRLVEVKWPGKLGGHGPRGEEIAGADRALKVHGQMTLALEISNTCFDAKVPSARQRLTS